MQFGLFVNAELHKKDMKLKEQWAISKLGKGGISNAH